MSKILGIVYINPGTISNVRERIWHAMTHTHHTLLAKAEKLLDFLRHEYLGAANRISNQLKNYKRNSMKVGF